MTRPMNFKRPKDIKPPSDREATFKSIAYPILPVCRDMSRLFTKVPPDPHSGQCSPHTTQRSIPQSSGS